MTRICKICGFSIYMRRVIDPKFPEYYNERHSYCFRCRPETLYNSSEWGMGIGNTIEELYPVRYHNPNETRKHG